MYVVCNSELNPTLSGFPTHFKFVRVSWVNPILSYPILSRYLIAHKEGCKANWHKQMASAIRSSPSQPRRLWPGQSLTQASTSSPLPSLYRYLKLTVSAGRWQTNKLTKMRKSGMLRVKKFGLREGPEIPSGKLKVGVTNWPTKQG